MHGIYGLIHLHVMVAKICKEGNILESPYCLSILLGWFFFSLLRMQGVLTLGALSPKGLNFFINISPFKLHCANLVGPQNPNYFLKLKKKIIIIFGLEHLA
jgi:hypothetical protein